MPDSPTFLPESPARALPRARALVIYNPVAGWRNRRRFLDVLAALGRLGCIVTLCETTRRGDAEAFARSADPVAHDVVIAAGGDGTINEVVNGLAGGVLPLAVIPLGTANVFAAELGLPGDADGIAELIVKGAACRVHAGMANGRLFIMMAGVGFDADVVRRVSPALKRRFGKLAYVAATLVSLVRYPFPRYRIAIDGVPFQAASAVVAKGHFYAGRFTCTPEARLDEALFHVCLFRRTGAWNAARYALALLFGRLDRLKDVEVVRGAAVTITGDRPEPVQGDGDIVASLPLHAVIARRVVTVVGGNHVPA